MREIDQSNFRPKPAETEMSSPHSSQAEPLLDNEKGALLKANETTLTAIWLRFADCALLSALRLPYKLTESTPCDLAGGEQEAQEGCSR